MPPATFRPAEVEFFRGHVPRWEDMKKKPVNSKNVDQLLKERTQFIRKVCEDFLAKFPERDPSVNDPGPLTFTNEVIAKLPRTVRQWFRNNTRPQGGQPIIIKQGTQRRTHARNLATQQYKQQIKGMAQEIRADNPEMNQMTAFNKATTQFMEQLKTEDPDAYNKLYQDAAELRGAAAMDYTDMSPDVLKKLPAFSFHQNGIMLTFMSYRLLSEFPVAFLDEIEHHGRILPVHIWSIVALAVPPAQEVKVYTMSTRSIDKIHDTAANKKMKDEFTKWLKENIGLRAPGEVINATEAVYPDLQGSFRPKLPSIVGLGSTPAQRIRAWLRTYFNYLYMWQGALGSVPWKAMAKDTSAKHIDLSRFPQGIRCLRSPSDMTRDELESWYRWILAGQEGRLRDDQIFQFALVQRSKGLSHLTYRELQISTPESCNLKWGPDEKLYAYKVRAASENALAKPDWLDLPLARLHCVHEPFSEEVKELISEGLPDYQADILVKLVADLERYGPIHTVDSQCTEPMPAYIDPEMSESCIKQLIFGQALRPAALLEDDPEHPDYALSTFLRWARTTQRFMHLPSGTWRGGPNGVRWILAIYLHFATTFKIYKDYPAKLPTDRLKALDACNFQRLRSSLLAFGDWFIESLKTTIKKLKVSFRARAQAWKEAVVSARLADPDDNIGHESVLHDTHGIPRSRETLWTCYEQLQQDDPDITLGKDNIEFSHAERRANRRAQALLDGSDDEEELSNRDSLSAEMIEFPEDDTEDEGDDEIELDTSSGVKRNTPNWSVEEDLDISNSLLLAGTNRSLTFDAALVPQNSQLKKDEMGRLPPNIDTDGEQDEEPEPSWSQDLTARDGGDEAEELPANILTGLSPVKLQRTSAHAKPTRKWQMEVVIPTSKEKTVVGSSDHLSRPAVPVLNVIDSDVPRSPDSDNLPDGSLATRRRRRSTGRSQQVEEAIRISRKGTYYQS
ncbi:hypothetical protein FRC11_004960 [Ceratobasidium sp. 423]|nr:hypothetical protein FRC11_004960 [Ceratobasidium sp. 423]